MAKRAKAENPEIQAALKSMSARAVHRELQKRERGEVGDPRFTDAQLFAALREKVK